MKITKYFKGNIKNAVLSPIFIIVDTLGSISVPYFTAKIMDVGIRLVIRFFVVFSLSALYILISEKFGKFMSITDEQIMQYFSCFAFMNNTENENKRIRPYGGMSQENCIEFLRDSKTATVTLSQGRMITRIERLAKKHPGDVTIEHRNSDGSIVAHIPVSYVHIGNYSREMSDEQRAAAAERMRKVTAERSERRET